MTQQNQLVISYKTVGDSFIIERRVTAGDESANQIQPIDDPQYKQWLADGQRLQAAKTWINFALAEWLEQGFAAFGEDAAQGIDFSIWGSESKLNKVLWVNRAVPPENRILDGSLTWSHFHAVAPIKDKAIQKTWLQKAIDEHLSANELGRQVKAAAKALADQQQANGWQQADWVNQAGQDNDLEADWVEGLYGGEITEPAQNAQNGHHASQDGPRHQQAGDSGSGSQAGSQANGQANGDGSAGQTMGGFHDAITTGHGFVDPALNDPDNWVYGDLPGQPEPARGHAHSLPADDEDPEGYIQFDCPHCTEPILLPKRMIRDALEQSALP